MNIDGTYLLIVVIPWLGYKAACWLDARAERAGRP